MSRSRKKNPWCGHTKAKSEKRDKVMSHRRIRKATKMAIASDSDPQVLPHEKELSSVWLYSKDGKQRVDPKVYPEAMRK